MIVSFPHMGNCWVPLKTLFDKAGVPVIVPPKITQRTLSIATKYSPEWACFPFKTILGNYIEALDRGADTLLGVAGPGLCRLGYYSKVHEEVLRSMGYRFEMPCFDWQERQIAGLASFLKEMLPGRSWPQIIGDIKHGLSQVFFLDNTERRVHYLRPRELEKGAISRIWRTVPERVCAAHDGAALKRLRQEIEAEFDAVPIDPSFRPLRVAFLGEFFTAVEPNSNMNLEEELGNMGVEVTRHAYVSDWARIWLFLEFFGLSHEEKVKSAAAPYLKHDVSGHSMQTLGETVLHSQEGFDGVIHIQPFTCTPEVITQNLIHRVSREHNIPVLSLTIDEQTGRAGVMTRLEAFVDLMRRRRQRRLKELMAC